MIFLKFQTAKMSIALWRNIASVNVDFVMLFGSIR